MLCIIVPVSPNYPILFLAYESEVVGDRIAPLVGLGWQYLGPYFPDEPDISCDGNMILL
jgi:hypothetical protein